MTIEKGLSILFVICLKIISSLLKVIFRNSHMIQRCLNKTFQRSYHCSNWYSNITLKILTTIKLKTDRTFWFSWLQHNYNRVKFWFFLLAEKDKIINYAEENPHLSSRKLAEEFHWRRTCIQSLIKQKEVIMTHWKCNENSFPKNEIEIWRTARCQQCCLTLVLHGKESINTCYKSYDSRRNLVNCLKIGCSRIYKIKRMVGEVEN